MSENKTNQNESTSGNPKHKSTEAHQQVNEYGGSENASASRGGTTDMDSESLSVDRGSASERGSGLTTKRDVTGSDFDGQTA